jgi:hypothetical protein
LDNGPSLEEHQALQAEAAAAAQQPDAALPQMESSQQAGADEQSVDNPSGVEVAHSQYVNGLGKFMVPAEGTLENHFRLIYERSNELDFWAEQSPAFDGLVAQTFLDPAFSDSRHPRYFDYEPLRDNISTVRNFVMQSLLSQVDTRDTEQLAVVERKMEQMGREIGVALQRDTPFKRPGSASLNVQEVSQPGSGAAKIYELLYKKQQKGHEFGAIKRLFGYDYAEWKLPEPEASPFSKANVAAFCLGEISVQENPAHQDAVTAAETAEAARTARREAEELLEQQQAETQVPTEQADTQTPPDQSNALNLAALGAAITGAAFSLDRVQRLPEPVKDRSVELAREILEKMRVSLGAGSTDQYLEMPPEEALTQSESISAIAALYADVYQAALEADESTKNNPLIVQGNIAMGKLAYLTKQQAGMKLVDEGRMDEAQMIMQELEGFPREWQPQPGGESMETLLSQVQAGLEQSHQTAKLAQAQPLQPETASPAQVQQQLQEMLQKGNLSPQELSAMREMQAQAATMQAESPVQKLKSHAQSVEQRSSGQETSASAIQPNKGNYRSAVQQHAGDTQLKR